MEEQMFDVVGWYADHLGLTQAVYETGDEFARRVKAAVKNDPALSEFDQELLEVGVMLPENSVGALWLKGNRKPIAFTLNLAGLVNNDVAYRLGNLTNNKGWARLRVYELKRRGMTGSSIALLMLKEGYSFNETKEALEKYGFACQKQIGENEEDEMFCVPTLEVSDMPYPRRYIWQVFFSRPRLPLKSIPWVIISEID
jgi:hypothetical protein